MERGETYGEQGRRLGQSQYHILNTGSQGRRCWFLLASLGCWNTVFTGKHGPTRALAGADSVPIRAKGTLPQNLLL